MNQFELKPARNGRAMGGPLNYLEIFVDGIPLQQYFVSSDGQPPDAISPLGWTASGAEAFAFEQFQRFLLAAPADLDDGRNTVLVCPLDGDPGCGAYSVRIEFGDGTVAWTDFGFENNYDPESRATEPYSHIGPFVFERTAYETELVRHRGAEHWVAPEPAQPSSSESS